MVVRSDGVIDQHECKATDSNRNEQDRFQVHPLGVGEVHGFTVVVGHRPECRHGRRLVHGATVLGPVSATWPFQRLISVTAVVDVLRLVSWR